MNKILIQLILVACASSAAPQTNSPFAHQWRATVTVLDEARQPVPGATVAVSYYIQPPPGRPGAGEQIEGLTDTNGVFKASHNDTTIGLGFLATKPGCYSNSRGYELGLPFDYDAVKWNPALTLVLKKVGQPIAMYAKSVNLGMPVFDKAVGFDLTAGDWAAPYGKGITPHILFTGHFDKHADGESDFTLTVSFPNPGDGIQECGYALYSSSPNG